MSRPKKSARLLQKLNQSLGEKEAPVAAGQAFVTANPEAEVEASSPPVEILEVVSQAEAAAEPAGAAATPVMTLAPAVVANVESGAGDRRSEAEAILRKHLPLAAGAGLIPLPGVDLVAIGALQLKVLAALARHYEVAFTRAQTESIVTSLLGSLGGTVVAGAALGSVAKFVPGLGTLLSITTLPIAGGAVTMAIGRLAIDHFEAGGTMLDFDLDLAQHALERKLAEAKRALT